MNFQIFSLFLGWSQAWTVVSSDEGGMCVTVNDAEDYFCAVQLSTPKGPIYMPPNSTESDLFAMDIDVRSAVLSANPSYCWTNLKHVVCGSVFAPCVSSSRPEFTGLCKSTCDAYADCDNDNGDNGDFKEFCDTDFVIDDSDDPEKVMCGKSGQLLIGFLSYLL